MAMKKWEYKVHVVDNDGDGLIDEEDMSYLEFLTTRNLIWSRFEKKINANSKTISIISMSWGELLRRKMKEKTERKNRRVKIDEK